MSDYAGYFLRGKLVRNGDGLFRIAGIILWRETLDWAKVTGIVFILVGIVLINVFSKSAAH